MLNTKYFNNLLLLSVLTLLILGSVVCHDTLAAVVNLEKINKASDPDKLDKYKKKVEGQLEATTQKKNILTSQVNLYNLKVNSAARNLSSVENRIERSEKELAKLSREIEEKDIEVKGSRDQLKRNIVLYERNNTSFELNTLRANSDVTKLMNQSNYINNISKHIAVKLSNVKKDKLEIIEKKKEAEKSKIKIEESRILLEKEKENLEVQRRIKNDFLSQTKGEENNYKNLLARISEQKQKIINLSALSFDVKSSLSSIQKNAKKPKDGLASKSWYYAQDDKKWGSKTIGFSKTLMSEYGCAVTALAMVFTEAGEDINPGKLAKKPLFYRDLIVWPNSWKDLSLKYGRYHGNVDWGKIDKQLKNKKTAIVFIKSRSGAGHYVVIHHKDKKGKYVVHDPLFGSNIYLDTSKKLVGAIYKSGVVIDQMLLYK